MSAPTQMGHAMRAHFAFPSTHRPFNNGSWGSVPRAVSAHRRTLLDRAEERTDYFQRRLVGPALLEARRTFAAWLRARVEDTVLVQNATSGANIVLRNIEWQPGDRVLVFDFVYDAFDNALTHISEMTGMRVERMRVPRLASARETACHQDFVVQFERTVLAVRARGETPRMVIFDTFPAVPAIRLPYQALVRKARELGVLSLVDGAHGIGFEPFDLTDLDADFFISNAHKWGFVPLSCAVLVVPERNHHLIRTSLPTGYSFFPKGESAAGRMNRPMGEESAFALAFRYVATVDWTPFLSASEAYRFRQEVCGGEAAISAYIASLASKGGQLVAKKLNTRVLNNAAGELAHICPMTLVLLPIDLERVKLDERGPARIKAWMEDKTMNDLDTFFKIDLYDGCVWTRLSAQIYLELSDFEWAAGALEDLCKRVNAGEHLES